MTTEMPPSGIVDVNVVVTFFDDRAVLDVLVAESAVGVALDVSRVVPCDVVRAGEVTVNVVLETLVDPSALEVSPALEEEEEERVADDDSEVADKDEEGAD